MTAGPGAASPSGQPAPARNQDLLEATSRPALRAPFSPTRDTDGPADPLADPTGPWPEPSGAYRLLWHAAADEVATGLPGLRALPRVASGRAHGGVDLVVDVDALGRLVAVDVEAVPLAEVLAALGDPAGAAAAEQATGQPVEVAAPAIADLLERLWVLAAG